MIITIRSSFIVSLIIYCIVSIKAWSIEAISTSNYNDFEKLMQKIRLDFIKNPSIDEGIEKFDEKKGAFIDIDYSNSQRTKWTPMAHMERLYDFAFAYTNPQNSYYKSSLLFDKIQKGLEFWHKCNPQCQNWWYNQIAEPQHLGILLIQMRIGEKRLPVELEDQLLKRMKEDGGHPSKSTGANRTDIALHWIYRSCLTENEIDLKIALENAYSPIAYTTKEGFQHDNSYFQHGTQLYIGGYGDEILKGITQIATYTKGTKYALPERKLALLSKFMRETYYSTIRGQYMVYDVLGRSISRPGATKKTHTMLFAKRMLELDPSHAKEYQAIIERLSGKRPANYAIKAKHTHYFRGDYTLHVRPEYTFDVRMVSNRTARCEYGNGENLKTYFMSDGCTNIVISGNEYNNIFPVWNWTRIPGITAPQLKEVPKASNSWQVRGTSTFAGGVSDSIYGVSTYSYMDTYAEINTRARKAWFFFDNEVVCLGAGIYSTSSEPVISTINQCLISERKPKLFAKKKQSEVMNNSFSYISPEWILHNKVGYLFPKDGKLFISNQTQTGSWYEINNTTSKEICQEKVLTIAFDHGIKPVNASYAYIVVPCKQTASQIKEYQKKKAIEILTNTKDMQVVKNRQLDIWQMVFYQAGEFRNKEIMVKVDQGCVLMIKGNKKQGFSLHIADPGQTQSNIKVSILIPEEFKDIKVFNCDFRNTGIYAGATQAYKVNL